MSFRLAAQIAAKVLVCGLMLSGGPALAQTGGPCDAPAEPVVSLSYVSRYAQTDDDDVRIDPRREAEAEAALRTLDRFIDRLADSTEALYAGRVKDRQHAAACIVGQLGHWAEADALSDLGTETVWLTIGSRYAAFALILWQTLPYAPDHPKRSLVLDWLDRRMTEQMSFWPDAPSGAQRGNLRAWAGLAAAALSVQTSRAELRNWSHNSITEVLCSADADGSLPQEMTRGKYALHYQLHAIAPLVTAAVLLERQGTPTILECDGALHRVVGFAVSDLFDGAKTKAITGLEQNFFDGTAQLMAFQLAWIEQYMLLRSSDTLEALARDLRPLIYTKLGGNQTALWRR